MDFSFSPSSISSPLFRTNRNYVRKRLLAGALSHIRFNRAAVKIRTCVPAAREFAVCSGHFSPRLLPSLYPLGRGGITSKNSLDPLVTGRLWSSVKGVSWKMLKGKGIARGIAPNDCPQCRCLHTLEKKAHNVTKCRRDRGEADLRHGLTSAEFLHEIRGNMRMKNRRYFYRRCKGVIVRYFLHIKIFSSHFYSRLETRYSIWAFYFIFATIRARPRTCVSLFP